MERKFKTEDEIIYQIFDEQIGYINRDENKYKTIHLIWSGGCDSTLLLWKLLNINKEITINTYAFVCSQVGDEKMHREKQTRAKFLNLMEQKGFGNRIIHKDIELQKDNIAIHSFNCGQPALWISSILPILPEDSILFAGYHKGDDFLTYKVMKDWLNAFIGLRNLYGKHVEFLTPFSYLTKYDIIKDLKSEPGLYEATWWCETPRFNSASPCGYCDPCKLHDMTIAYIKTQTEKYCEVTCAKKEEESEKQLGLAIKYLTSEATQVQ